MGARFGFRTITGKLLVAFLAVFIPLMAVQHIANVEHSRKLRTLAREAGLSQTRTAAAVLDGVFQDIISNIQTARDSIGPEADRADIERSLEALVRDGQLCSAAGMLDSKGVEICRYPSVESGKTYYIPSDYLQHAHPTITPVQRIGERLVFAICTPTVLNDKQPVILYAVVNTQTIRRALHDALDESHCYTVLDQSGKTACRLGNQTTESKVPTELKALTGINGYPSEFRKKSDVYYTVVSPISGWRVVLLQPGMKAYPYTTNVSWPLLSVLVIAAAVAVVFKIGNRIASPIRKLSRAAEAVAVGDLRRRVIVDTGDELQSLAECFNQMTASLERQQRELQLTARVQQSLLDVARSVTSSLDMSSVTLAVVDALKRQFGARQAVIFQMDAITGRLSPIAAGGDDDEAIASRLLPVAEHALTSPDVLSSPTPKAFPDPGSENSTIVTLPLVVAGRPVGVLAALFPSDEYPEPELKDQHEFLKAFASSAAIAVHNAYIHGRTEELIHTLDSLRRVDEAISKSLDLKQVLRSLVNVTAEVMSAKTCVILLPNREGRLAVAETNNLPAELRRLYLIDPGEKWSGISFAEKRPIARTDIALEWKPPLRIVAEKENYHGFLCAPLIVGEEAIGTINVLMDKPYKAKQIEIELLSAIATHAAVVIANAKLFSKEYQIAETLQSTLIGAIPERIGRLVFGHKYLPALDEARVGGDLFDVMDLPNGKIALIVADVSGKGIQAAVHTAMVRYMTRAFIFQWPDSPAAALDMLNRSVFSHFGAKTIVTVFCAVIDTESGWMAYANAGHPPAIVLTQRGKQQILFYRTGLPIGYSPDSEYEEREVMLEAGDLLLLYTDGIIEARRDKTVLSIEGLQDILFEHANLGPRELVDMVCEETGNFADNRLRDDIAVIAAAIEPHGDRQRQRSKVGGEWTH